MTETFVRRPLWQLWCEQVIRDVRGDASPAESAELRDPENLVSWLQALQYGIADIDVRIGDSKLRLKAMSPAPGVNADAQYLAAKREYDLRHARRIKFRASLEARVDECRFLLNKHLVRPQDTAGYLITVLSKVEDLLDRDEVEGALRLAKSTLDKIDAELV